MVPRMERFQLSKVVTVSSTDGPTVHPRLPDCPSWAARLSTWQAPTVHRSVGQGGPTVHRVGRLPVRQPDCPRARLRLSRASVGLPTRHRRTVHGQPGLPRRAAPTAHAGSRRQPDCRQASARLLSSRIFTAPTFGQPAGRGFGTRTLRRGTRTLKGDPDLEGATVGEPSGAASGGLVAHSRCHVPGGLSAARWHTHGARGSRLCTMRITPDHATPRPVCPQAMPEAVRVFRPVALAPGGLGSQRYQVWCDMRV